MRWLLLITLLMGCGKAAPPPPPASAEFTIVSVGDVNLGEDVVPQLSEKGARFPFAGTRELIAGDFLMGNLETVVAKEATKPPLDKSSLHLSDPAFLKAFQDEGFDLMVLGNNHAMDQQGEGLIEMLGHLDDHELAWVGAGRNLEEARRAHIVEGGGLKIAILSAYWPSAQKAAWGWYASEDAPGTWVIDRAQWTARIKELRAEGVDYVIASVHWGGNYISEGGAQKKLARKLVKAGVDLINGHGAHLVQGIEVIDGVPVLYGLGNYVFGSHGIYQKKSPKLRLSVVARYVFAERELRRIELMPIRTDNRRQDYVPVPAEEKQARRELEPVLARYKARFGRRDDGWYVLPWPQPDTKPLKKKKKKK